MSDTTGATNGRFILKDGRGIWIAPKVAPYVNSTEEQMFKKMQEVFESGPEDQSFVGGQLTYKGFVFREYKAGSRQRFFAWWWNKNLVVFALGAHSGKNYDGMMYDGTASFPVKYDNFAYFEKNNESKLAAVEKDIGTLIKALWPFKMNTMNTDSPYGAIYD